MRALFVSPHLDDVAFSCGGTFAALAAAGHECVLLTVFTRSVPDPTGFALACQLDKGLNADVDYMALRRAEDHQAARRLGAAEVIHLDLPEAPHRGYESAQQLFEPAHEDDKVTFDIPEADLVFVPMALGDHVDHHQVVRAVGDRATHRYADLPYALRLADPPGGPGPVTPDLHAKLDACAAYTTQLGFQFGGEAAMRTTLSAAPERFA